MACWLKASPFQPLACLHACPQAWVFTSCITFKRFQAIQLYACVCRSSDPYLVFQRDRMIGHKTLLKTPVGLLLQSLKQ